MTKQQVRRMTQSKDPAVWAKEFQTHIVDKNKKIDEAEILGWFANAMASVETSE